MLLKELYTILIAALPVLELRGAIPIALKWGIPLPKAYALAFIGNMLPVPFILLLLEPVSNKLRHFKLWSKFFDWLLERTKKRAKVVERFEALGLILFVAIPLPITGAWTGCVAAILFGIRRKYALPAIALGVLIAGLIVTGLSKTILNLMGL